jgi:hypothetical protein
MNVEEFITKLCHNPPSIAKIWKVAVTEKMGQSPPL